MTNEATKYTEGGNDTSQTEKTPQTATEGPRAGNPTRRGCETCRWHKYLKLFDEHICQYRLPDGTRVGPISRLDADCDVWEDAHKCSGCPECIVRFDADGIHGHVPDNNSTTCRECEHNRGASQ